MITDDEIRAAVSEGDAAAIFADAAGKQEAARVYNRLVTMILALKAERDTCTCRR